MAISDDYAIVGAYSNDGNGIYSGSGLYVRHYYRDPVGKTHRLRCCDGTTTLASSVAISGDYAIVGAYGNASDSGSAYVFDTTTGTQLAKLTALDAATGRLLWQLRGHQRRLRHRRGVRR